MTIQPDYFAEFQLNLDNQLKDFKPKEFMQVGYQVDNVLCYSLIIPNAVPSCMQDVFLP